MTTIRTIDAHVGGAPLRLIVDGFPSPRGTTMPEMLQWSARRADHLRRVVMCEPRGHVDMCGAVLSEAVTPGADAGLVFMHNEGFSPLLGHGIIAVATIALERGLVMPRGEGDRMVFDTAAGTVRATIRRDATNPSRVGDVSYVNVPSFVLHPGVDVPLPGRRLRADVAYGGEFYAIVDAESAGVAITGEYLADMRRLGTAIAAAVNGAVDVAHPVHRFETAVAGTIFTAPASADGADLRSATVFASGAVDRSPSGNGTAAIMAVLDAMGLLAETGRFVHEGLVGTRLDARLATRTRVGAMDGIVPEISGRAWITGEHTFVIDPNDPLADGFRIS